MGRTVVLGSINQDLVARTERLPLPGQTVIGTNLSTLPGGKGANQAVAAAVCGSKAIIIGAVGRDNFADQLRDFLAAKGVDVDHVSSVDDVAGTALIVVSASGENSIVVVPGANAKVTDNPAVELAKGDVLLAQFEVPRSAINGFFARGREQRCLNVLNPSPFSSLDPELLALTDVLVVNENELRSMVGVPVDVSDRKSVASVAREAFPSGTVVVTLGASGVVSSGQLGDFDLIGHNVVPVDTTGAGDCFTGSLAAELSLHGDFQRALAYANRAAAVSTTRRGAGPSMPSRSEVND